MVENLVRAAVDRPDHPALELDGLRMSYAELLRNARNVAAGLEWCGIEPGARVALLLPNGAAFVECLHAGWLNGNTVVPIVGGWHDADGIRHVVQAADVDAIVVCSKLLTRVEEALTGLKHPPQLFVVGAAGRYTPYRALLECRAPATREPAKRQRADVLNLFWQDVAGREPKAHIVTSGDMQLQLDLAVELLPEGDHERVLCVIELASAQGMHVLCASIRNRGSLLLQHAPTLESVLRSSLVDQVTTLVGRALQYHALGKRPEASASFERVRRCINFTASMISELGSSCARLGAPMCDAYAPLGVTAPVCCYEPGRSKRGSVGRPYPYARVRIVDADGATARPGQLGRIFVAGAVVPRPKEWLDTHDAGYVDEDGFLFLAKNAGELYTKMHATRER